MCRGERANGQEDMQQQGQEENKGALNAPYLEPSIRVVTTFFAAVLGFGLKHMLDIPNTPDTEVLYDYKWGFFAVTIFIFLRYLSGSANHLWLEYVKVPTENRHPDFLLAMDLLWLTAFGCFGVAICYMRTPDEFFVRTSLLLLVAFAWTAYDHVLRRIQWRDPVGEWTNYWTLLNLVQIASVVFLSQFLWGTTGLGVRLLLLASVSLSILAVDFSGQLTQLKRMEAKSGRSED
jgi:hypothetical protein